jgi:hypothetical protein
MKGMTMEQAANGERGHKPESIKVVVTFPLARKGPYQSEDPPDTQVEPVRVAAMSHFGIADDGSAVYYLTHGRERPDPGETIGSIADKAGSVKFSLVKELIQG